MQRMKSERVSSIEQLRAHVLAWTRLVEHAVEENLNYEPVPLLALLDNLSYPDWFVILIWRGDELCGFFPMQSIRLLPLPIDQFSSLFEDHFMSCAPLIHKSHTAQCMAAFWEWFNEGPTARHYYVYEVFDHKPFSKLLMKTGAVQEMEKIDTHNRASLNRSELKFPDYWQQIMSGKSRNSLQRKQRKLADFGAWRVEYAENDPLQISRLLQGLSLVESQSWKGDHGSSIASHPALFSFMEATAAHAAKSGRLMLAVAYLDDKPAAAQYGLINDGTLLIYKIGVDSQWKNYSIGHILMLDIIEHVLQNPAIDHIDSCASADADMFNRCLADRVVYSKYRVASTHWPARASLQVIKAARQWRDKR